MEKIMNINQPIVVQLNPIKKRDGSFKNLLPVTLNSLDFVIIDDNLKQTCSVQIRPFPKPLVLWSGNDYVNAGDYTQAQVEQKLLEVLGNNPSDVLKTLMPTHEIIVK